MGRKTFEAYMRERGFELRAWQRDAANALLGAMSAHRGPAAGKSFLMQHLASFIDEWGNCFSFDGD